MRDLYNNFSDFLRVKWNEFLMFMSSRHSLIRLFRKRRLPVIRPWGWGTKEDPQKQPLRAKVIRQCLKYKDYVMIFIPHVPFPQENCSFSFRIRKYPDFDTSLPVGLLIHLWEHNPDFTGDCPYSGCDGKVYGHSFGGVIGVGGIAGVCIKCQRPVINQTGGLPQTLLYIKPHLEGTPYMISTIQLGGSHGSEGSVLKHFLNRIRITEPNEGTARSNLRLSKVRNDMGTT